MIENIGVIFALGAMLAWGFGDFLIQRTVRLIGVVETLFLISFLGSLGLLPFVFDFAGDIFAGNLPWFLVVTAIIGFVAGLIVFRAFDIGKLAVMEPILGLELPISISLAFIVLRENVSLVQGIIMITILAGIILTVTREWRHLQFHKNLLERGFAIAILGALGGALFNVAVGFSSKSISPVAIIWLVWTFSAFLSLVYIVLANKLPTLVKQATHHPLLILIVSVVDLLAWLLYAKGTSLLPVAITVTISEGYVALAAILGIFVNHEMLKRHQIFGITIALGGIILLSYITH